MGTLVNLPDQTTGVLQASKLGLMTGDSGAGGASGAVPAPPAGSAAAGKFLKADGTFQVPSTNPLPTFVDAEVPSGAIPGTSYHLANTPNPLLSLILTRMGIILKQGVDYTIVGTLITLNVSTDTNDILLAWYRH